MVLPSKEEVEAEIESKPQHDDDVGVDVAEQDEEGLSGNRDGVNEGEHDNDDDDDNNNNNDDDAAEEGNVDTSSKNKSTTIQKLPPPPKPVKRARLAYSIFCDEKRPEMQEEVSVCDKARKFWTPFCLHT
jgi:hypothetical protein